MTGVVEGEARSWTTPCRALVRPLKWVDTPSRLPWAPATIRSPAYYNARAGGAQASRHITFNAVDLVPRGFATRFTLQPKLLHLWWKRGKAVRMGLGLYGGTRFHVDAHRYRRW